MPRRLRCATSRRCAAPTFASLQHACEHYLAAVGVGATPSRAAIAVASPVSADEIRLTNRAWSFSRTELEQSLGLDRLLMLNDFGAVAWAVPALGGEDVVHLYGPSSHHRRPRHRDRSGHRARRRPAGG